MDAEQYDLQPYGISETRRLTVPSAEKMIFEPRMTKHGIVRLVDYMGGDESVLYAATGGIGREAIAQRDLGLGDMFDMMRRTGVVNPFKFVQAKMHMEMPIQSALFWVYFERFKINEYSGRFSVMMDNAREVTEDEIGRFVKGRDVKETNDKTAEIRMLFDGLHRQARGSYEIMLAGKFARELARIGLGLGNYTKFYLSANLEELLQAADQAKQLAVYTPDIGEFAEEVERVAKQLAPEAVASIFRTRERRDATVALEVNRNALESKPSGEPRYSLQKTKRLTVPEAEDVLFLPQGYLDKGWFMPTDYMGSDASVVQSARVSYGAGTTRASDDKTLIRYLRRHRHTTPFEHISFQAESKTPIFIRPRQAGRHRTWDKEGVLGQWIPLADWYDISDDEIKAQSGANRQGRGEQLDDLVRRMIRANLDAQFISQSQAARQLRENGVPWHLIDLRKGVGHYTLGTEKVDLHNLAHYLGLRDEPHAQKEIQLYAQMWDKFFSAVAPVSHGAYVDYQKHALTFTAPELKFVAHMISGGLKNAPYEWFKENGWVTKAGTPAEALNREAQELQEKLRRLFAEDTWA